jgi:predicted nucleic acid-binding protein
MVLVDTSIWVSHFQEGNPHLKDLLLNGHVVCHSFIIGELACGNLQNREEILSLMQALPSAMIPEDEEVLELIDTQQLMGMGLGYVDVHLLASSLLSETPIWTEDKKLKEAARKLNVSYR